MKLGIVLGDIAFCVDRRGRAVALANLECVFGDRYTPAQRRWIARLSYRNFARTMLDLFWAAPLVHGTYRNFMEPHGFADIREQLAREGGANDLHVRPSGNWEWASLISGFEGFFNTVVTENFRTRASRRSQPPAADFWTDDDPAGALALPHLKVAKRAARPACSSTLICLASRHGDRGFGLKMCVPVVHRGSSPARPCAPRARGNRTAPRRHLLVIAHPGIVPPPTHPSANLPAVLGLFRTHPAPTPRPLALALQALPLPPKNATARTLLLHESAKLKSSSGRLCSKSRQKWQYCESSESASDPPRSAPYPHREYKCRAY